MKAFILGFAIVLFSTPAFAGGIYNDSSSLGLATGAANTPTTLWSQTLAGGAIGANNAILIHLDYQYFIQVPGSIAVYLNGVLLVEVDSDEASFGTVHAVDIRLTRNSNSTSIGYLRSTLTDAGISESPIDLGWSAVSGFAFTASQTLTVVGESEANGGLSLVDVGIQR